MKYIYPVFAIGFAVLTILFFTGILKPNLQITAGTATLAVALYYGHRTFLSPHDEKEINKK